MANLGKARIKAKEKKGVVTVKMMAKHPQLSHQEAKKSKKRSRLDHANHCNSRWKNCI